MRFPSVSAVAKVLRTINARVESCDDGCDVRLQVYPDGSWAVRWGLSDYDDDHRGYWGASSVPGGGRRFDSRGVARDVIGQAQDHHATSGDRAPQQEE